MHERGGTRPLHRATHAANTRSRSGGEPHEERCARRAGEALTVKECTITRILSRASNAEDPPEYRINRVWAEYGPNVGQCGIAGA